MRSAIELCGRYFPAVAATLEFLESEKQSRKKMLQESKQQKRYKRTPVEKIKYENIAEIMSCAFGPDPRYMDDIRRCYFGVKKFGKISPRRDSSWAFNAKLLEEECSKYGIDISTEIEKIQWLYISTLTVEKALNLENRFFTIDPKDEIRQNIQSLYSALETNYGPQYWKVVFKYFPKCVNCPAVKDLLILLPQCKSGFIDNWIRQLDNVSSSLHRRYKNALEERSSFLQNYSEELLSLANGQSTAPCTWEEVFYSLTVEGLLQAKRHTYLFKAISEHKLRADDLRLAYLVETQLSYYEKELFYDELADEIHFDGVIAF